MIFNSIIGMIEIYLNLEYIKLTFICENATELKVRRTRFASGIGHI